MKQIISIVGPTGVGKTKLSVALATHLGTDIINCDAMQVYKHLNIGTAKATPEERCGITHHLLDLVEVDEGFSIYRYQTLVRAKIEELHRLGKVPILVGGSGHYLKSVLYDYSLETEDEVKKESILSRFDDWTNEALHDYLTEIDEPSARVIHQNNRKRVLRAISYYLLHGKRKSDNLEEQAHKPLYDALILGLTTSRELLYQRINDRVDEMIASGLVEEVKALYDAGYDVFTQSIRSIGYKELYPYFDNEASLSSCVDLIKKNSRNYAKRQYTYFRNQLDVTWLTVDFDAFDRTVEEARGLVGDFLEK